MRGSDQSEVDAAVRTAGPSLLHRRSVVVGGCIAVLAVITITVVLVSGHSSGRCAQAQAAVRAHLAAYKQAQASSQKPLTAWNGRPVFVTDAEREQAVQIIDDNPSCFSPDDVATAHRILAR